jgi:hypothetical protein
MRDRCDFHRSTIAIENAFIDYTVFIPLSQHRSVIAASHVHRNRNCKLRFFSDVVKRCLKVSYALAYLCSMVILYFYYSSANDFTETKTAIQRIFQTFSEEKTFSVISDKQYVGRQQRRY